ncbi:hypothetical protein B0A67_23970 [Flavobacterium aquidurense]|uniref:hypothetical protein n=1 Tax=Flavobacterium aquidurense TaxID=362413 RepID=UPI00091968CA|nr:hypothetical protein [Flavobacterium aquidurense]OXA65942.1 hypothetical protein B0A67_23970 [Flavobacterium aquidurense]SHH85342.1 hypothetical protein SAMN05444481_13430 [Flavobacterium frigidimaris]
MISSHLGNRFKEIRISVFEESQEYFCEKINEYILIQFGKEQYKNLFFSQPLLSSFEKDNKISLKKYILLLNYLYKKKNINPSWLLLENNNNQPKLLKQLEIDQTVVQIVDNIEEKYQAMSKDLNDLRIIIDNSVFG